MSLGQVSTEFSLGFLTPGSERAEKRKGKRRGKLKSNRTFLAGKGNCCTPFSTVFYSKQHAKTDNSFGAILMDSMHT